MSMRPRTSPNQAVPTRPLRTKGIIRSRVAHYSVNGTPAAVHRARYVVSMFPGYDTPTYRAMHNALDRYMAVNRTGTAPTRAQILAQGIFDGLL